MLESPLVPVIGLLLVFVATAGLLQLMVQRRVRERRVGLTEWAAQRGLAIDVADKPLEATGLDPTLTALPLFARRSRPRVRFVLRWSDRDGSVLHVFDFRYVVQSGRNSTHIEQTVAAFRRPRLALPAFQLTPEGLLQRFGQALGDPDIDFDDDPEFSRRYQLRGEDADGVRRHFRGSAAGWLTDNPGWSAQGAGEWLVVFRHHHTVKVDDFATFVDDARTMSRAIIGS